VGCSGVYFQCWGLYYDHPEQFACRICGDALFVVRPLRRPCTGVEEMTDGKRGSSDLQFPIAVCWGGGKRGTNYVGQSDQALRFARIAFEDADRKDAS